LIFFVFQEKGRLCKIKTMAKKTRNVYELKSIVGILRVIKRLLVFF